MSVNSDMARLPKARVIKLQFKVPIRKLIGFAPHHLTIQTVQCVDLSLVQTDGIVN